MTGDVVIDLGERPRDPEPEPAGGRPRPPARWWRAALPLLLALGTLTAGAAPPAGPPTVSVPATDPADFLLLGDRLLVLQGLLPADGTARELVAYRLPDGEPLWRRALPDDDVPMGLTVHDDLLLVSTASSAGDDASTSAITLDAGELRWQRPGRALAVAGGGVLLETHRPGPGQTVRAVDPATGAPGWAVPVAAEGFAAYRYAGGGVDLVAAVSPAGRVELYDPRTGARLGAADLPRIGHAGHRYLELVGDVLLVGDGTGGIAGYDVPSLRRRWTLPPDPQTGWASPCGPAVCLHQPDAGVRVVDPETGRTRWADPRWSHLAPVGDRLLAESGRPDDREDRPLAVLDPATGRVLGELGRWQALWEWPAGQPRYGLRRLADGRMLLAELDLPAARTRVLTVLPGWARRCGAQSGTLVCQAPGNTLRIWRLR
ncbi:PQQ-binding-like beta-propeller repeat protein [Micromonospora sp. C28SCA-DRY-2]|uniref:outer membrane protein assembly factor BamB family protein n=1 Tax=Micromonospora sp. C28SCA-DRY-2 TaxID=3059522 RepID=UPI002674D358|nr:PQQ-binding-like beta-propeller repeat protein [Micromonospora sp. C28SCA-DRY-2]MDO3700451.1 PQQ-binding-like beta-propeller repeat protein [Micromonospora sp. C28SCA-DRY-2]